MAALEDIVSLMSWRTGASSVLSGTRKNSVHGTLWSRWLTARLTRLFAIGLCSSSRVRSPNRLSDTNISIVAGSSGAAGWKISAALKLCATRIPYWSKTTE